MKKKIIKAVLPLLVVLLVFGIALIAAPKDVFASGYPYPEPSMIQIGFSGNTISFSASEQYYKNGDEARGRFTGSSSDYNAYYSRALGILYLDNYNGPTICVIDGSGQSLAVFPSGNCVINADRYGIVAPDINLSFGGYGHLTINVNNSNADEWPVAGIATYIWGDGMQGYEIDETDSDNNLRNLSSITVYGHANVDVNVNSAGNGNGIVSYGKVSVKDNASLCVDTRVCSVSVKTQDVPNKKVYRSAALFIGKDQLKLSTDQIVDLCFYDSATGSTLSTVFCQPDYETSTQSAVVIENNSFPMLSLSVEAPNRNRPGVFSRSMASLYTQASGLGYTYDENPNYNEHYHVFRLCKASYDPADTPIVGCSFPSPFFRDYVKEEFDVNGDGFLDEEEADSISELDISYVDNGDLVTTLKGLEYLTGVEDLDWTNGALFKRVILSDCTSLRTIDVSGNSEMGLLYVNNMPYLEQVYCVGCGLDNFYPKDSSSLEIIDCSNNNISSINLGGLSSLIQLDCSINNLKVVGARDCTELEKLNVSNNPVELMEYHIATCKKLKELYCNNCLSLTKLDVTPHKDLEVLECQNCGTLGSLNLSKNTNLTWLKCSECGITSLDISNNTKLKRCICWGNGMEDLTLGVGTYLEYLDCHGNCLGTLDIRFCNALVYAYQGGVKEDYGGYVTYSRIRFNLTVDKATTILADTPCYVMSFNATLSGDLFMNSYNVPNSAMLDDQSAYFRFRYIDASSRTDPVNVTEDILIKDTPENHSGDITRRVLTNQFFIAQLHDYISIEVFDGADVKQPIARKTGSVVVDVPGGTVTSSAWEYLEGRIANSTNPAMVALAKAIEYYGTAAQLYFDYNTYEIPNSAVTALNNAISDNSLVNGLANYEAVQSGTLPAGIDRYTSSLVVEADHSLVYHFYLDGSKPISSYKFYIDYGDGKGYKSVTPKKEANNKYCIQVNDIPSGYLSKTYKFKVTYGTQTCEIQASALSYALGRVQNSTDPNMVKMAKALYLYSMAANAYFGTGN